MTYSCAGVPAPWEACDSGGGGEGGGGGGGGGGASGDGATGAEVSSRLKDLTRTPAVCITHRCKVSNPANASKHKSFASCMHASALLAKKFMALSKP